jgi:hypothetical protein
VPVGAKWGNLEDVEHLHLKLHALVYSNKTYSASEFLTRLRKDIIRDLLSQARLTPLSPSMHPENMYSLCLLKTS